jgi:hypothetical protein
MLAIAILAALQVADIYTTQRILANGGRELNPLLVKRFMDIQFRDFEWTDGRHDCGVIAHELQTVYPDLITGEKDAVDADGKPVYQQVNYTGLICRMGAVIQQLEARLAALENK